jgi:hypothetical protein
LAKLPTIVAATRGARIPLRGAADLSTSKGLAGVMPFSEEWREFQPPPPIRVVFFLEQQVQSQWCWAAVAVSVDNFYPDPKPWTQCELVGARLTRACCGTDGDNRDCDRPYELQEALGHIGRLATWSPDPMTPEEIRIYLAAGRPIPCRIAWGGADASEGHFVVITGCHGSDADLWVHVEDPNPQHRIFDGPYEQFRSAYATTGVWAHTYYLKPRP